jgi:DoxX-like family
MQSVTQTAPNLNKLIWTGRIISALIVLLLLFSGVGKLFKPPQVVDDFTRLGYPGSVILGIGIVEIACAIIYAIPRTAVLGAILVTGYLGGATATHVRVGDPIFNVIMPIIIGVMIWVGIFLREGRLRALLPLRS